MSKWLNATLSDICLREKSAIISGPFGSNISSRFFVDEGVPVIRGNNLSLSLDKFYDDGFVFVTDKKADELNCYAQAGDLVFTAAGTIGQVGILEAPLKYEKYVISNKQLRARIDVEKIDLLYAYYWFSSPWMQDYFIRNNKGSTVPLITLSELKEAPISYPEDKKEQKRISAALEVLSRKIENNKCVCCELESMVKTLYDYWFIQFDFPNAEGKPYRASGGEMVWNDQLKREIPKGWIAADIKSVCEIVDCLHSKKPCEKFESEEFFLLTLENLTKDGYIDLSEKYYISQNDYSEWTSRIEVRENDFVVTNAGRAGDIGKIPKGVRCAIGRNLTAIRPVAIDPYYLRGFFRSGYVQQQIKTNLDSGSLFKSFNVKSINKLVILIPDKSTLNAYLEIAVPIVKMIEEKLSENQILQSLRDWLLPMLMNGQATVE